MTASGQGRGRRPALPIVRGMAAARQTAGLIARWPGKGLAPQMPSQRALLPDHDQKLCVRPIVNTLRLTSPRSADIAYPGWLSASSDLPPSECVATPQAMVRLLRLYE